ncbi:hypothetical protein P4K44_33555 [Bacillus cereus]|uniref:hypothetical protein n=1 Tax=Bacillus pumilus TaxID=1408 RepID=UPI00209F1FFB|nr:hypothetical protein [Bacillus pumilus]MCP1528573.1 hypothetical protein [Bacillus pumilus]MDF9783953.1 hypothetical protein [Bacillus pumilus]MEB9770425.1 hypothetical protein [Bacillus cereus]MED1527873.1 hypothetical protein [Bacillus pumilus]
MAGKIKIFYCSECDKEDQSPHFRHHHCGNVLELIERDKKRETGNFKVVDWFSTRSSAGLVIEDESQNIRREIFMSDLFKFLKGVDLGKITLEEVKKGSAYSWKVVN